MADHCRQAAWTAIFQPAQDPSSSKRGGGHGHRGRGASFGRGRRGRGRGHVRQTDRCEETNASIMQRAADLARMPTRTPEEIQAYRQARKRAFPRRNPSSADDEPPAKVPCTDTADAAAATALQSIAMNYADESEPEEGAVVPEDATVPIEAVTATGDVDAAGEATDIQEDVVEEVRSDIPQEEPPSVCPPSITAKPSYSCKYYLYGTCRNGRHCTRRHDPDARASVLTRQAEQPRRIGQLRVPRPATSLLRTLLEPEIRQQHNAILECFKFLVESNFFQDSA
ncbi:unnamed protein product (mitochondrion) [Plasmodiophora brassicae]|uniref:C3H1-type domain-containing protein n=2 Tax=Plasmodiophora brassicae TaxID=37360 RepID=A0A3P3YJ26_PLABS|nr:unnamed protein product [Plasmodiophora brassicae]